MLTIKQKTAFINSLKAYKRKYIVKKYAELDESATRLMINYFLVEVLGYKELEEIKTEYSINGTYADYVIQLDKKQHIVIEVKAIQINISEKHIRQAIGYATNEGINWVLLTNGRYFALFRVIFGKPIRYKKIFNYDLSDLNDFKSSMIYFEYLTMKCVRNGELEKFWQRFIATEPANLSKYLYNTEIIKFLKRSLKRDAKLNFSEENIFESVHEIIINPIQSKKPKFKK